MAAFGLIAEGLQSSDTEIWPDNWDAVQAFCALSTQWRISPAGSALGIDYAAVLPVFRLLGFGRGRWPEIFDDLRALERHAVEFLGKR